MGLNIFNLCLCLLTVSTTMVASIPIQNHLVMPHSAFNIRRPPGLDCLSWRLAVETNNKRNWIQVPGECRSYVATYMQTRQYLNDCDLVAEEAYEYAQGLVVGADGMDIWVFDVDETAVSNLQFFASINFNMLLINETSMYEWFTSGEAPAIPACLKLYKRLLQLGFKIVFLTGADTSITEARAEHLRAIGYTEWEKLILKDDAGEQQVSYKSRKRKELEEQGYRIRGNVGDQWSDLLGTNTGDRTFKLPNPMYYAP